MEEYTPNLISIIDEDGTEHAFEELDRIETDNGKYVALLPFFDDSIDMDDDLEDDFELIILKVTENNNETFLEPIEDENEFNEIGAIFEERLSEFFDFED